jgi:hypothetical protein
MDATTATVPGHSMHMASHRCNEWQGAALHAMPDAYGYLDGMHVTTRAPGIMAVDVCKALRAFRACKSILE